MACSTAMAQTARTVRHIAVVGNSQISEAAILAAMRTRVGSTLSEADLRADETSILDRGYFRKVALSSTNVGENQADVVVNVEEYPVVKEIRIVGNSVVSTAEIEEIVLRYQNLGEIWNNRNALPINNDVRALYDAAGYFAQFEQIGPMTESPGTLNIVLLEARIGTITYEGLNRTRPSTINRIMQSEPGEAFNIEKFRRDMMELRYTNWFRDIQVERTIGSDPSNFDFRISFEEDRTAMLNAGVALDPQSRIVGTLSYSDSNFRGSGQSVGVLLSQATVGGGPSAELVYGNRWFDDRGTSLNASIFSKVIYNFTGNGLFGDGGDADNRFNERQTGFSASMSRPFGENYRSTVGILARNSKTIDLQTTGAPDFIQQDHDMIKLQVGGEMDTTFPRAEPFEGRNLSLLLEPGYTNITAVGGSLANSGGLLGDSFFVRSTLEYRQYWSKAPARPADDEDLNPEKPRPVLAFRARYGYISGTVPFFEQMFVGGAGSLRGYPNQRFWGNQSFLSTLEYRYPIQDSFSLVGFADYGGAWGGYGEFGDYLQSSGPDLRLGYGAGLAFRVPGIGSIRIDFAFNQEGGSRTHFSFGSSF